MNSIVKIGMDVHSTNYTLCAMERYYSRGKVPRAAKSRPPCREIATIPQLLSR